MKIIRMAVLGLMLIAAACAARADNGWGLFGSYWSTKDLDGSPGAGAKLQIEFIESILFEARGTYYPDVSDRAGQDLRVIPAEGGLVFDVAPTKWVDIFAGGGLGYYFVDSDADKPACAPGKTKATSGVGFYLTAGIQFLLQENPANLGASRATFYVEGMYRSFKTKDALYGAAPDCVLRDAKLDGPAVNAGLMLRW